MDDDSRTEPAVHDTSHHESNLLAFPISSLSGRPASFDSLTFQVAALVDGVSQEQRWTLEAGKSGLPTAFDRDVLHGLFKIANDRGLTDRRVPFTIYEVLKTLRLPDTGENRRKIKHALRRWVSVSINTNAFWDASSGVYREVMFHVIDEVNLVVSRGRRRRSARPSSVSYFELSKTVWNSLRAGYLTVTDFDLYVRLPNPTSKRLYDFLNLSWDGQPSVEFDLRELCYERLGVSRTYRHQSRLVQALRAGYQPLEENGYLRPGSTVVDGDLVRFTRNLDPALLEESAGEDQDLALEADEPVEAHHEAVVEQLVARGVSRRAAAHYVRTATDEELARIPSHIAHFDRKRNAGERFRNPGGMLMTMIRENWALPSESEPLRDDESDGPPPLVAEADRIALELEYERWCDAQADDVISRMADDEFHTLSREIRAEALEKSPSLRMSASKWGDYYRTVLRRRIRAELSLPDLDSWLADRKASDGSDTR